MSDLSRWFETVRRLRPSQVGHRITRRLAPSQAASAVASTWRGLAPLPLESRRPRAWPYDHRAENVWRFAGRAWPSYSGDSGLPDAAAAPSMPLLATYHARYADWIRGLAEDGQVDAARVAVDRWFSANDEDHPYVRARRVLALIEARIAGLEGCETLIAADADFVDRHVERDVGGNHLVANATALFRAGFAITGGPARRWRERGGAILTSCVRTQVLADGMHFERSPVYQGLVLEHLLIALESAVAVGESPPRGLEEAARSMAETLGDLTLPDGELLRWKDGAPGLALPDDALRAWAGRRAGPLRSPRRGTRVFEAAGLAVVETEDGRSAATLLAGPPCPPDLPAHGHADANAYEAVLDGVRVVASAGTADYAEGPERDRDRRPGAFAGVLVDGCPPADPYAGFRVGARGWVRDLRCSLEGGAAWASASSDGFTQTVGERILHRRTLALLVGPILVCVDEFLGRGAHDVDLLLPLGPGLVAEALPGAAVVRGVGAGSASWGLSAPGFRIQAESAAFATGLGTTVSRSVLKASAPLAFPARVVHAWTPGRPARRIGVTPVQGSGLRVEIESDAGAASCFVYSARRP